MNLTIIGVLSQSGTTVQTVAPTIFDMDFTDPSVFWGVSNNDTSTAIIKTELDDTTPDLYSESEAYLGEYFFEYEFTIMPAATTIYATAQASGKSISTLTSQYMEL